MRSNLHRVPFLWKEGETIESDNWIIQNLNSALATWNERMTEIWTLITTAPEDFRGSSMWYVVLGINVEIDDPTWQENIIASHLDSNTLKQNREVGSVHITSSAVQRPVVVQDDYIPYARVIISVSASKYENAS